MKLQRSNTHDILLGRLGEQPGLAKQIFDFQATITKAVHDTIPVPLDPDTAIKYTACQLNSENHKLLDYSREKSAEDEKCGTLSSSR
jgi:hypothetical protein